MKRRAKGICQVCRTKYPEETLEELWRGKYDADFHEEYMGQYCEDCLPRCAYLHPTEKLWVVDTE